MADNFQQTVNLKEAMKDMESRREKRPPMPKREIPEKDSIENVYAEQGGKRKDDFQKMEKPSTQFRINEKIVKTLLLIIALVIVGAAVKFFYLDKKSAKSAEEYKWYSVKLVDGEIFFGQIANTAADPVSIKNVYYDYDQLNNKDGKTPTNETGNLRLVKRGKETHGPDGSLDVVRAQVLYMEQLKDDSKVLKAILNYENN